MSYEDEYEEQYEEYEEGDGECESHYGGEDRYLDSYYEDRYDIGEYSDY